MKAFIGPNGKWRTVVFIKLQNNTDSWFMVANNQICLTMGRHKPSSPST